MAFTLGDRGRETSTTTGTGSYLLSGAIAGFRAFSTAIGNNQCSYVVTMGSQFESGIGTLSGSTLARTLILSSTSGGSAVNWGTGTKDVRCDVAAAVVMQMYNGVPRWVGTLGGTADVMTASISPPIYSYFQGLSILAVTSASFTGNPATLNVNSLGGAPVRRWDATALTGISIGANTLVHFCYDGATFRLLQDAVIGGSGSGVTSIFGRTGTVVAQSGDYTPTQILPSLSGNALEVLRVNSGATGVEWAPASAGSGQEHNRVIFTSSGTYTKPSGLIAAFIRCQAPGGGSGGVASTGSGEGAASPGGGGGEYRDGWLAGSAISTNTTVTIGSRGSAGSPGDNQGGDAGSVSFGFHMSAEGGQGSTGGPATSINPGNNGGPGGQGGNGGSLVIVGRQGGASKMIGGIPIPTNNGGASHMSTGSAVRINDGGQPGHNYGGGASGAYSSSNTSSRAGAQGGGGICIIEEVL